MSFVRKFIFPFLIFIFLVVFGFSLPLAFPFLSQDLTTTPSSESSSSPTTDRDVPSSKKISSSPSHDAVITEEYDGIKTFEYGWEQLWKNNNSSGLSPILLGMNSFTFTDDTGKKIVHNFPAVFERLRHLMDGQNISFYSRSWRTKLTFWAVSFQRIFVTGLKGPYARFLRNLQHKTITNNRLLNEWNQQSTLHREQIFDQIRDLLLQFQFLGIKEYYDDYSDFNFPLNLANINNLATIKFADLPSVIQARIERLFLFAGNLDKVKTILGSAIWKSFHDQFHSEVKMVKKFRSTIVDNKYPLLNRLLEIIDADADNRSLNIDWTTFQTLVNTVKKLQTFFNPKLIEYWKKKNTPFFSLLLNRFKTVWDHSSSEGYKYYRIDEFVNLSNLLLGPDQITLISNKARKQLISLFVDDISYYVLGRDLTFAFRIGVLSRHWNSGGIAKKEQIWNDLRPFFLRWKHLVSNHKVEPINIPLFMAKISNLETVRFAELDSSVQNWLTAFINYAKDFNYVKQILENENLNLFALAIKESVLLDYSIEQLLIGKERKFWVWETPENTCSWWKFWCKKPSPVKVQKAVYEGKLFSIHQIRSGFYSYSLRFNSYAWLELETLRENNITVSQFKDAMRRAVKNNSN